MVVFLYTRRSVHINTGKSLGRKCMRERPYPCTARRRCPGITLRILAVPYEYVPFAAPGYWAPNPTLSTASFYDEFYNEDALDALK